MPSVRPRSSPRRMRWPSIDASTVSYVETHGTGTPLGDPIEIEGLRQAFDVSERAQTRPVLRRFGQVQHRSPGDRGRDGRPDQGDPLPEAPGNSGNAALHQPQPRIAPRPGALRRARRVRSVGMGRRPARGCQLVRRGRHQCACCPRRGAGPVRGPTSARVRRCSCCRLERPKPWRTSRSALAAELSGPDELNLSDVAFTLAGRRKEHIRMAAVVNDQQHAATVLRASEHDNVFVGESVTVEPSAE